MKTETTDNSLDDHTALELLYHISREIANTLDLQTLLERILSLSIEKIGAVNGSIIALDDKGLPLASTLIINQEVVDFSTENLQQTLENGLAGWVARNRQTVLIPNTSDDERWLHLPDDDQDATGPKSVISVPLLTEDTLSGVITLVHPELDFFTQDHKILIQAIADQSSIAVMNANSHAGTLRQARILTALSESAAAITSSLQLTEVLERILEQICLVLQTEAVSFAKVDLKENTLEYIASTSEGKHSPIGLILDLDQGISGWVAKEKKGVIVLDAYQDERFYSKFDEITGFRTKGILCSPILSEGELLGVIQAINPKSGKFETDALEVLERISTLAGTAIRHSQLFEAHQAAHKRYHDLFEGNVNTIILTDRFGEILEVNQQALELTKKTKDQLVGSYIKMIHEADLNILGVNYENISDEETLSYESILFTKTGLEIPVLIKVKSIFIEGEEFFQWVLRDVSERKELEKLREDLLTMICHDIRSPLANITSSLDVLQMSVEPDETNPAIKSLFEIAARSARRIQRLTQSMLDINRLEAGHPVVDTKPTTPISLLQDALEILRPLIENKNIEIEMDLPRETSFVIVNEGMIQRVLINLIENAIKFTPTGSKITVGINQSTTMVNFRVMDSGPGIPVENRQKIFDKYKRFQGKEEMDGYGIGLAYCRLAVESHGGFIWVDNVPGGGSQFSFTLPVYTNDLENSKDIESNGNG
jgi:NtrC-family two-component system sensor histidine kinase KinB